MAGAKNGKPMFTVTIDGEVRTFQVEIVDEQDANEAVQLLTGATVVTCGGTPDVWQTRILMRAVEIPTSS